MSATTDRTRNRTRAQARLAGLFLASLVLLGGCAEEALPERKTTHDDCLRQVDLKQLRDAITACDKVVAAFPQDPWPLNERYLLHSLAGDMEAACRDNRQAVALARRLPPKQLDRLLRNDLELREQSCRPAVIGR